MIDRLAHTSSAGGPDPVAHCTRDCMILLHPSLLSLPLCSLPRRPRPLSSFHVQPVALSFLTCAHFGFIRPRIINGELQTSSLPGPFLTVNSIRSMACRSVPSAPRPLLAGPFWRITSRCGDVYSSALSFVPPPRLLKLQTQQTQLARHTLPLPLLPPVLPLVRLLTLMLLLM